MIVARGDVLTADDEELRVIARGIVATITGMATTAVAEVPEPERVELGHEPITDWARVRNITSLYACDDSGNPICD